jgi:hypothetical protein
VMDDYLDAHREEQMMCHLRSAQDPMQLRAV